MSVLNACGPGPVMMSSPSVVFTDEQALIGDKGTLYSSTSDEAASSITDDINYDSSQPESSQVSQCMFLLFVRLGGWVGGGGGSLFSYKLMGVISSLCILLGGGIFIESR